MGFANIFRKLFATTKSSSSDAELGVSGERIAAQHLQRLDYRILERNWRSSLGELDIICRNGDTLVFVEVKTSRKLGSLPPEIRVNARKRHKLQNLARHYLKIHHLNCPVRFDVISVWWESEQPQIRHIENAF